jgi:uncharacterized protein YjbI with pentapeptide repeats
MANLSKVDLTKAILVHSSLFLANLKGANPDNILDLWRLGMTGVM